MLRDKIETAFNDLRELGYFCEQDFWCCQGCAWSDIPDENADKVVFYHQQDAESIDRDGSVYLAWNGDPEVIKAALYNAGLSVDWNGKESTRFKVS